VPALLQHMMAFEPIGALVVNWCARLVALSKSYQNGGSLTAVGWLSLAARANARQQNQALAFYTVLQALLRVVGAQAAAEEGCAAGGV
jgi:hypothetical protein